MKLFAFSFVYLLNFIHPLTQSLFFSLSPAHCLFFLSLSIYLSILVPFYHVSFCRFVCHNICLLLSFWFRQSIWLRITYMCASSCLTCAQTVLHFELYSANTNYCLLRHVFPSTCFHGGHCLNWTASRIRPRSCPNPPQKKGIGTKRFNCQLQFAYPRAPPTVALWQVQWNPRWCSKRRWDPPGAPTCNKEREKEGECV